MTFVRNGKVSYIFAYFRRLRRFIKSKSSKHCVTRLRLWFQYHCGCSLKNCWNLSFITISCKMTDECIKHCGQIFRATLNLKFARTFRHKVKANSQMALKRSLNTHSKWFRERRTMSITLYRQNNAHNYSWCRRTWEVLCDRDFCEKRWLEYKCFFALDLF